MADRLTAMDVQKQEFRTRMRGFDPEQVKLFLRAVADEVERLNLQNAELREKNGRLRESVEEYRQRERTLQETLVTAQQMAHELKERSKGEAEDILREARRKAERTLQHSQDQLARLEAEIRHCKLERDLFERRVRSTIEEHLSLIEGRRENREPASVHPLRHASSEAG